MKIERKTFKHIDCQEESWLEEKPTDGQEVVPMDQEVSEGFLGSKKGVKKGWRPLNEQEVLQQVYDFVNCIGKERLVNLCEYRESHLWCDDDKVKVWVIWFWAGN